MGKLDGAAVSRLASFLAEAYFILQYIVMFWENNLFYSFNTTLA